MPESMKRSAGDFPQKKYQEASYKNKNSRKRNHRKKTDLSGKNRKRKQKKPKKEKRKKTDLPGKEKKENPQGMRIKGKPGYFEMIVREKI